MINTGKRRERKSQKDIDASALDERALRCRIYALRRRQAKQLQACRYLSDIDLELKKLETVYIFRSGRACP
ncbi:hypothetical protein AA101099_2537 [Neoasaia chiangmaiensis NBRC 101099]|nr:hypothetical protein [Neoasaia chiangmaiensis]GBR41570.1 hypothetical protein AA101099_2537 [Neoasaia chiangmaiensis NBRC 101099]